MKPLISRNLGATPRVAYIEMLLLASLVFGLLAFLMLGQSVQSLRARGIVPSRVPVEDQSEVQNALRGTARRSAFVGASFALAALAIWWSAPLGLVLGGTPILLFALLAVTGNVTVIRQRSAGE